MPNPFKKSGGAFHQGGEWFSPRVGLIGKLDADLASGSATNLALIGDIGSGKTAALSRYKDSKGTSGVVLLYRLDELGVPQALNLHDTIMNDMIDRLGEKALDAAAKALGLSARSASPDLRRDQKLDIIAQMAKASSEGDQRIHLLIDECQYPAERLERSEDTSKIADWFGDLKVLGEVIQRGGGRMVITITPSPWSLAPPRTAERFTRLESVPPSAPEIDAFILEGLKHTKGDKPDKGAKGLGAGLLKAHEGEVVTVRRLHERLHVAWEKAHDLGATTLGAAHLV